VRTLRVKLNHKESVFVPFHWMAPFKDRGIRPSNMGTYLCRSGRADHPYYYRHYGANGWGLASSTVEGADRMYKLAGSIDGKVNRRFCWRGFTTEGFKALSNLLRSS
jgi:hypothetical protein